MEFALTQVFAPGNLLLLLAGIMIGLLAGITPGLTISLGMTLALPITFGLSPLPALSMLVGLYVAGMSGGAISAILLNIPGTPAAAATRLDGYPLARRGQPELAILVACLASFFGGLVGLLFLVIVAPPLARLAIHFGPAELFCLILLGMILIAGLSAGKLLKGSIAAVLGFMLATVGMDPMLGTPRLTFGAVQLMGGLNWLPVMIGGFALPEILAAMASPPPTTGRPIGRLKLLGAFKQIEWKRLSGSLVTGGLVGTGIGFLPGANAPVAVFLAYEIARRRAKHPELFGHGAVEGIAAPEAANSAVAGGAMIPMLTLGIPGDTVTAILLSAFTIQGFTPGPLFFTQQTSLVHAIFLVMLLAIVFNFIIICCLAPLLAWLAFIPTAIIMPCIALFCVVGTLLIRHSFLDLYTMIGAGVVAYLMSLAGFPFVPLILAMILGPQLETNLRLALILADGNPLTFFTSPISASILAVAGLFLAGRLRQALATKDTNPA